MAADGSSNGRKTALGVALIGATGTIIAAIITGIIATIPGPSETPSPPNETLPSPPATRAVVRFTEPALNAKLQALENFVLAGEVTGLPQGSKLWVIITPAGSGPLANFHSARTGPVATMNGSWTDDYNYFAPSAAGRKRYYAVQADAACHDQLIKSVSPERSMAELPPSCEVIATLDVEWLP